jgi:hypothetical protein
VKLKKHFFPEERDFFAFDLKDLRVFFVFAVKNLVWKKFLSPEDF